MLCGLHKRTVKRNSAPSLQRNLRNFLPLFKLSLHRSPQSPRLPTSFTDTLGLLLHRPNIKSYKTGDFKPWVVCTCHTHTGSGQGPEILACVAKWGKNIHSKFQVCSYYSFQCFKTKIQGLREITPFLRSCHIWILVFECVTLQINLLWSGAENYVGDTHMRKILVWLMIHNCTPPRNTTHTLISFQTHSPCEVVGICMSLYT